MAKLRRVSDGEGDSGSAVTAVRFHEGEIEEKQTTKPIIGWSLKVGSVTAGTYSTRDWWMTTPVTEILEEDSKGYYKFKTGNSIYEFWL